MLVLSFVFNVGAMSRRVGSSMPAPSAELMCSRCYKRESCVRCCGIRFCLRHFHTTNHSSEHPHKAVAVNQEALDKQMPAFQQMWREAFQSVADDVERISQEVGERVAQDPLASIGMPRPAKPRSSGRSGKGPGDASGRNEPATTKRRRLEEKEKGEPVAKAAVLGDPFARRRTRPQSYWAVGAGGSSLSEGKETNSIAPPPATAHMGEYKCEACESLDTSFDIIGGAAGGSRKAETFGNKDAPELILRVVCHACGYTWMEER